MKNQYAFLLSFFPFTSPPLKIQQISLLFINNDPWIHKNSIVDQAYVPTYKFIALYNKVI